MEAGSISIHSPEKSLSRLVQEDVFFSVDVKCAGVPTIRWMFMSGLVSRTIGTWQPGTLANITADYSSRVQPCPNGSMGLADLRLQDAGYYVVTVTDGTGSSRDAGLVLKVNGETLRLDSVSRFSAFLCGFLISNLIVYSTEVLYEDLQYLSVSAVGLAGIAGLLMLSMWLLDKLYRRVVTWRRKKQKHGKAERLRQLERVKSFPEFFSPSIQQKTTPQSCSLSEAAPEAPQDKEVV